MSNIVVDRKVLEQALEALESLFTLRVDYARPKQCGDAITALRAALEQPEQEPVADLRCAFWLDPECADAGACQSLKFKAHPPRRETEQEPVADSFTMDELTEAAVYAEIPDGPFQSLLIGLQEAVKQRAALKEKNYE